MSKNQKKVIETNEARGGRKVKGMTVVLALSTIAAIIIMMLVFAGNAAS